MYQVHDISVVTCYHLPRYPGTQVHGTTYPVVPGRYLVVFVGGGGGGGVAVVVIICVCVVIVIVVVVVVAVLVHIAVPSKHRPNVFLNSQPGSSFLSKHISMFG